MSDLKPVQKVVLRLIALTLCLLSLKQSWAGVGISQGKMAMKHQDYPHAVTVLERALKWDPSNTDLLYSAGFSAWAQGQKKDGGASFVKSAAYFTTLTQKLPYYGRAWLYLGLNRLAGERGSSDGLTSSEWIEIKELFLKALQKEPGSAWMAYVVGTSLLSQNQLLTAEEKEQTFHLLQKSASIHRAGVASPYLKPGLSYLWRGFSFFKFLKDLTPRDYESYQALLEFMDREGLWEHREEIFSEFLMLRHERANELCLSGQTFLEKGAYASAVRMFKKASWADPISSKAKAGLLASQQRKDPLSSDNLQGLQRILEDEDEELGKLLDDLGLLVERLENPYLQGLYAVKKGEFYAARAMLERVEADQKFRRRYLALSYWKTGAVNEAIRTLEPALSEKNPDLRELLFFMEVDSQRQTETLEKIKSAESISLPPAVWQGKDFKDKILKAKGKAGLVVNLRPGKRIFHFQLRLISEDAESFVYLIFRLRERAVGSAYVDHADWKEHTIEAQTAGGKSWLEAEFYKGAGRSAPAAIEMGGIEIA